MGGLKKLHGEGTYIYIYTLQLIDQIGPVDRFGENITQAQGTKEGVLNVLYVVKCDILPYSVDQSKDDLLNE